MKPCYNCPDRVVGCHSSCNRYKEFKLLMEERNTKIKEYNEYDNYMGSQDLKIKKYIKRKGAKKGR